MPSMPGMRLPYVNDLFQAAARGMRGAGRDANDIFRGVGAMGLGRARGVDQYGGMAAMDKLMLQRGRKRVGIGAGALGAGIVVNRSSGARGLDGRSSGAGQMNGYGRGGGMLM